MRFIASASCYVYFSTEPVEDVAKSEQSYSRKQKWLDYDADYIRKCQERGVNMDGYIKKKSVLINALKHNEEEYVPYLSDNRENIVLLTHGHWDHIGCNSLMKKNGARSVRALASHGIMSGPASERVEASAIEEMVFTDSIPYAGKCTKVKQLSIAPLLAQTIQCVENNESISKQYLF